MRKYVILFLMLFSAQCCVFAQSASYFPHKDNDNVTLSAFEVSWYSKQLSAMNEPVLFDKQTRNEIYRFTWLRTFHHPVAIRFERQGNSYIVYWKMCSGTGGYQPGKLIKDSKKVISKSIWGEFIDKLTGAGFWQMTTKLSVLGNDGSEWILEGKAGNKYHVVDRWTPDASTDYYKCCDFLIGLTDLEIKGPEKY